MTIVAANRTAIFRALFMLAGAALVMALAVVVLGAAVVLSVSETIESGRGLRS